MSERETEIVRPAIILQGHLRVVDQTLMRTGLTNREQISIGVLATALAFRRLLEASEVRGEPIKRGERMRMIKAMVEDFEKKIRKYGGEGEPESEGQ